MEPQRTQRTPGSQRVGTRSSGRVVCAIVAVVSSVSFVVARAAYPDAARVGTIRGRVELRRVPAPVERRPSVSELGAPAGGAGRDLQERARSVVYLESAPRGAFEQSEPGRAVMDQRNETFVPHVLAITTGTTVDFPNSDRIYHNVFSLSKIAGTPSRCGSIVPASRACSATSIRT